MKQFTVTRQAYTRNMTAQPVPESAPAGTEIWYSDNGHSYTAACFTGKAQRPGLFTQYRSAAVREADVARWLDGITANAAYKAERKAAKAAAVCPFKAGDILAGTWGYEQTNVEFAVIVAISGKRVTLRELGHVSVSGTQGFMSEAVKPGRAIGDEVIKIAQTYQGQDWYIKWNEHCHLSPWHGRPVHKSWYA